MGLRGSGFDSFMDPGSPSNKSIQQIISDQQKVTPTLRAGRGGRTRQPRAGTGSRESLRMAASAAEFMVVPSVITEGPAQSNLGKAIQTFEMLPFVPKGLGKVGKHLVKGGMDPQNAAIAEEGMKIMSGRKAGISQRAEETRRKIKTMETRGKHGNYVVPTDVTVRRQMALAEGAKASEDAKRKLQVFPENPVSTANRNTIKIADNARKRMGMSTPSPFSGPRSPLHNAGRHAGRSREYKDEMTQAYYEGKEHLTEGFETMSPIQLGEMRPKGARRKPAKRKSARDRYDRRKRVQASKEEARARRARVRAEFPGEPPSNRLPF